MVNTDVTKRLEILLIEDNEDDAERIERSLDPEKYHITNVWNGKNALDILVKQDNDIDIDVVLLDKSLPYKNGLEILKETRENGKKFAFIFLTIDNTVETAVEAMKLGALDFLPKSSGFEGLPEMIGKVHAIHQSKLERKRVEEALWESEVKHRTLFESSRDAIMTLAPPAWLFTSGNPATMELFGVKDEAEFISLGPWQLSPERQPDNRPSDEKVREMFETAMRNGSHFFEWTHCRWDGTPFLAEVLLTRMEQRGNVLIQSTVRDITERKQAEAELQKFNEKLEQLVIERTAQLEENNEDLERMVKAFTGREIRMAELKKQIAELEKDAELNKKVGDKTS